MTGPRVYTAEEANQLIPVFEQAFRRLDRLRDQLKAVKVKLSALEMIWGDRILQRDCPDHGESVHLIEQLKQLQKECNAVLATVAEHDAQVKDLDSGLVDVYHVHDRHLVYLCWQRGEEEFVAWHAVDEGFASREAL